MSFPCLSGAPSWSLWGLVRSCHEVTDRKSVHRCHCGTLTPFSIYRSFVLCVSRTGSQRVVLAALSWQNYFTPSFGFLERRDHLTQIMSSSWFRTTAADVSIWLPEHGPVQSSPVWSGRSSLRAMWLNWLFWVQSHFRYLHEAFKIAMTFWDPCLTFSDLKF